MKHISVNNRHPRLLSITTSCISLFILLVLLFWFHNMQNTIEDEGASHLDFHFTYSTVEGYFLQSEKDTDPTRFDFKKENFGLIPRTYDSDPDHADPKEQWRHFEHHVRQLNQKTDEDTHYKVLFLGRHGQGWHNVAESKYGTSAWDCYWSMLDGADGLIWADANLTAVGEAQATEVHQLWDSLLPNGIPAPESYYVSPLTRALKTADLSFQNLDLPKDRLYEPVVKEVSSLPQLETQAHDKQLLREAIGVHTCDRRNTATYIRNAFPHAQLEAGFSETDPLWTADYREPELARRYRLAQLLDDIFAHDDGVFLSLTSHSGAITETLEAIGHRAFALETGGVIPVFIKAKKVAGEREQPPKEPSAGPPPCPSPPAELSN
ncbi:phosphoglycerate mutase-like protein [Sporormia fimetaria CBS 119925]|uniref:Phosphoglycerate mutase-like protein n=1 Tax=Sporormia fimetaria CBS 119925 TaxID=1340428 RepID=A0A6A6UVR5_9PLEO|nr:phosphoglycerate mutase-like protein [Sporormia fimetaria CBS 119925]